MKNSTLYSFSFLSKANVQVKLYFQLQKVNVMLSFIRSQGLY